MVSTGMLLGFFFKMTDNAVWSHSVTILYFTWYDYIQFNVDNQNQTTMQELQRNAIITKKIGPVLQTGVVWH